MKRIFLLVLSLSLFVGCAERKPFCADGFFGRTAITPPGTGTAQTAANPYYAAAKKPSSMSRDTARAEADSRPSADPVASWKRATDEQSTSSTVGKSSTSSSWNLSRDTTRYDPSVQHASLTTDSSSSSIADRAVEPSRATNNLSSSTAAARWSTGRSRAPSSIRTCIEPPSFAHSPVATSSENTDSVVMDHSATASETTPREQVSTPKNSARQPVVRMLQPHAMASVQSHDSIDEPTLTSTSAAQAPKTLWHNPSTENRTISSATITNVSHTSSQPTSSREIVPSRVVNIADLPDPGTRASRQRRVDANVRPASAFTVSRSASVNANPASRSTGRTVSTSSQAQARSQSGTTPSLRYGHGSAYGWLRGRLEYSEIAKRWKLRYIPIDGKVDHYGGSVVLRDSTLLDDQHEGDFVEVHGRLLAGENQDWGYAPIFEMAQLRPLGK